MLTPPMHTFAAGVVNQQQLSCCRLRCDAREVLHMPPVAIAGGGEHVLPVPARYGTAGPTPLALFEWGKSGA
jgi:hypothetical protein